MSSLNCACACCCCPEFRFAEFFRLNEVEVNGGKYLVHGKEVKKLTRNINLLGLGMREDVRFEIS